MIGEGLPHLPARQLRPRNQVWIVSLLGDALLGAVALLMTGSSPTWDRGITESPSGTPR